MKVGDVVKLKSGLGLASIYYGFGVIILIDEYGGSGLWCQVQWANDNMWHVPGDLELISESR
jgi:hypothetical protein